MKYKTILKHVEDYLKERRILGYRLGTIEKVLRDFAKYVDKIGHTGPLTTKLIVEWAILPQKCKPHWWTYRLAAVRDFAKYMKLIIPETEIPPEKILGHHPQRRSAPHIYSKEEIAAIMKAAGQLTGNGVRPYTYATLFGLLVCSGIRISEALDLSRGDIDFRSGILTIVEGKFYKSRLIPLHPTALKALKFYVAKRDKRYPIPKTDAFFVNGWGTPLKYSSVIDTFCEILCSLGWRNIKAGRYAGPRIYDMRHTFATWRLLEWSRNGENIDQKIKSLSTFMGHSSILHTYWYLSNVPELMEIIGTRFEKFTYGKEK